MTTPLPPEGDDEIHTTELLAQALTELGDPALADMVDKARAGHYHDFLSPHSMPEVVLIGELHALGHLEMAQRVIDGEFTASPAESAAWAGSPDGRETFAALIDHAQAPHPARPVGEAFWRAQR